MRLTVMKFGGTSVSSRESRLCVIEKIRRTISCSKFPVVVVSAMGRQGDPYATDSLLDLLTSSDPPDKRTLDLLISCGEIISAAVMAHELKQAGIDSVALTGAQAEIQTNGVYGNAEITQIGVRAITSWVEKKKVPIIAGFQGVYQKEITTLGRGGSDTVAVQIGCALAANQVEIFTDVENVLVVDPRIVPGAQAIEEISFSDMLLAAENGSGIIHPRAVHAAKTGNVPVIIRSTFENTPGTKIGPDSQSLPLINLSYNSQRETLLVLLGNQSDSIDRFQSKFGDWPRLNTTDPRIIYLKVSPQDTVELITRIYEEFYQRREYESSNES